MNPILIEAVRRFELAIKLAKSGDAQSANMFYVLALSFLEKDYPCCPHEFHL